MTTLDQAFAKAYGRTQQPSKKAAVRLLVPQGPEPACEPPDGGDAPVPQAAVAPDGEGGIMEGPPAKRPPARKPCRTQRGSLRADTKSTRPKAPRGPDTASETGKPSGESRFRPLLEVDSFLWPKGVLRLVDGAEEPLEQLLTSLVTHSIRGQKVIGWQGCRRGDGCTTLLLAAARRLAERGVRVAVVDADTHHPRIARHLGLMPTAGWEEVLAGRLPLAEVVVESLEDRVALVPWCTPSEKRDPLSATSFDPTSTINTLRDAYDLVLVDLGRGGKDDADAPVSAGRLSWMDAVLLVHNVRKTPQTELNRAGARLRRAGVSEVAVVENFV
jgi:Mrp family chromosome partitioning ATPase